MKTVVLALPAAILCLCFGSAWAGDSFSGKTFRVTGTWNGTQLLATRIQLREAEQDTKRAQLTGSIDSVDTAARALRIGPLNIEWNDKTEFKTLVLTELKAGMVVRATGRKVGSGHWLASSIQPGSAGVWPNGQLQVNGVATATGEANQIYIADVPVRLRGAGYNRVESLTQRQDTRRPDLPFSVALGGRPLTITGDYSLSYRERKNFGLDDTARSNLDQEAKLELFYPYRDDLYFFAEAKVFDERGLRRTDGKVRTADGGVKRGQMWIFLEGLGQGRVGLQLGRQNFKETREWWWDDDLDAARMYFDQGPLHVELGLAKELARESSIEDGMDPRQKGVYRAIGQASWLWASRQSIELYAMHQDDRSPREAVGSTVLASVEDDSDAKLTWLGLRAIGQRSTDGLGSFKYWADVGVVRGRDTTFKFDDAGDGRSSVDDSTSRKVRGHAFDVGLSWEAPLAWRPSMTIGYAQGSGDDGSGSTDRSFRQTGLHNNKARFFGVNRFRYYGELLRPELSNLTVTTLAFGVPFFNRSSVELVHHRYRQVKAADFMRDVSVNGDLTGDSRDIGSEFDLIFGFRDLARWDFSLVASRFKAGKAYGEQSGKAAHLILFEATYNF